ncbi:MAG: endo-1,4-beta-xylanase [Bacteroidota bacterium]
MNRRQLLKTGALGAAGLAMSPLSGWKSVYAHRKQEHVLRPYPHPLTPVFDTAYATDVHGDAFAPLPVTDRGVALSPGVTDRPFAVNGRHFVEGFGNVWLEADNAGQMFTPGDDGASGILNVEFARTRVHRNGEQLARYQADGTQFSTEVRHLHDLSSALLEDALRAEGARAADLADRSLLHGLWAGEKIELEKARSDIQRMNRQDAFYFGCETRHYVWAKSIDFEKRFPEVFNYGTITHYVYDTWYEVFEPREGEYRWGIKDNIVDWMKDHDMTIEGRPLFWFHPWVTPVWLAEKNFEELKDYVVRHTNALVGHYGDDILHWEVVNEYHDWANVHNHTPEQITEIVRLACETTHDVNPRVERQINNCCTFGSYAAWGHDAGGEADRPLRTPRKFMQDIVEAEVPFEVLGLQMYFPQRCISDIVRLVERFVEFGKPISITEIGTSSGPTREDILTGSSIPAAPYDWHRPWDDDLQADWLEQLYTVFYSKPYINNVNWYDFADIRTFIPTGGVVQEDGTPKASFHRLKDLLESWGRLPEPNVRYPESLVE